MIVRWHGPRKVESFLKDLCAVAKDEDSESLVTYTNFPTTEYLELPFVDVFTFNLYLHRRQDFCSYLSRLQHIAGELPMILTEFGICSFRHSREGQADFLHMLFAKLFPARAFPILEANPFRPETRRYPNRQHPLR